MGRPFKEGLDYFELDCQMDEKIKLIQAQYGLKGFAVVVKLFQHIYGEHGYYCEWNEDALFLFLAENCSGGGSDNKNLIAEIVKSCIKRGIFSEDMFNEFGILTSQGIQKRYIRATAKRGGVKLKKEYLLVHYAQNEINDGKNPVSSVKNSVSSGKNAQRREEKRREEKRREEKRREEYRQPGVSSVKNSVSSVNNSVTSAKNWQGKNVMDYHSENVEKLIEARKFPAKVEFLVKDWVRYKSQTGYPLYDTSGNALVIMIADKLDKIGEEAVCDAITSSIANGYKGIVFDDRKAKRQQDNIGSDFSGSKIGGYDWDAIRRSLDD